MLDGWIGVIYKLNIIIVNYFSVNTTISNINYFAD